MTLKWKDVIKKPEYQALSPKEKIDAQAQYFDEVVAPRAGDDVEVAREQFYKQYPIGSHSELFDENPSDITPPKRTHAEQLMADSIEAGKGLSQAAVNLLNIPGYVVNSVLDVMGVPKEDQVMSIQLPESMRPTDPYAKMGAEIGPYLIPGVRSAKAAEALSSVVGTSLLNKAATKATEILAENLTGALAQSAHEGDFGSNLLTGGAGSLAGRGLTKVAGKIAGPVLMTAKQWLSPTQKVISDAATAAREGLGTSSEQAQTQAASELGKMITSKDFSAISGEVKPQQSILDAAKNLDMEEALIPSHYSGSQTYRAVEQGLKSVPASQLKAKEYAAINALAQKADDLITLAGGTPNKVALSEKFKAESLRAINELFKESDKIYNEIGKAIPAGTLMSASSATNMLLKKAHILQGVENLSAAEKKVLSAFREEKKYFPATMTRRGEWRFIRQPSYGLVDNIRKQIGAAINKNEGPFKDQITAELKQLYGAITDDQAGVAQQFGMKDKWNVAKGLVAQRKQLEEHMVTALGKDLSGTFTNKMAPAIQNLRKGNVQAFDKLIAATPPAMRQEVVATALNDVFTLGSRKEKQLNIPGFVDWYEGARKSGALNRVMALLPKEARQNLSSIYKVSSGIRRANEESIGTGRLGTLIEAIDARNGVLDHLYAAAERGATTSGGAAGAMLGGALGGPVGSAAGAAIGAGLGGGLSRAAGRQIPVRSIAADALMADPAFQQALIKATEKNKDAVGRHVQNLPAWKRFAAHLSGDEIRQIERVGIMSWLNGEAD